MLMSNLLPSVATVISWLIGTVLIGGIVVHYLQRYIDVKLDNLNAEHKADREIRLQRSKLEQNRRRAAGRLLFWLHRAVVTGEHNGQLENAMAAYNKAEDEQKALDQQILAEYEIGENHG